MRRTTSRGPTAYKGTQVPSSKSREQIEDLLTKYHILDVQWSSVGSANQLILQFIRPEMVEGQPKMLGVRINVPDITPENRDQRHRALYYWLKTKFEALEFGLTEFQQEFFPHLVINDGYGSRTMYEALAPEYRRGLATGQFQELTLLPAARP